MKKSQAERPLVIFSTPDSFMNEVTVFRVLSDNSQEPIGKVYPDLSNGEDSLIYISTNNQSEEIFPPTADFIKIENRFKKYAEELSIRSFTEAMTAEAEKIENRKESVKSIRNMKIRNRETQQIIK